jgi:hypothetical protein
LVRITYLLHLVIYLNFFILNILTNFFIFQQFILDKIPVLAVNFRSTALSIKIILVIKTLLNIIVNIPKPGHIPSTGRSFHQIVRKQPFFLFHNKFSQTLKNNYISLLNKKQKLPRL